jgi:transcriptional regulator with XRE-family HTH domain
VDVSAFIRPRTYTPRDATIYQQRPAALIDAVEEADAPVYPTVHVFHRHSAPLLIQAAGPAFLVTHQLTGATRYALCDRSWSTTATSVIDAAPADAQEASWEQWAEQAREAFEHAATQQRRTTTAAARLRVDRLAAIQAALGFTTQDLAAVLGLSRPQLYRWLDAADDVRMQDAKRQRLAAVERVAKAWQDRSPAPLRSVAHEPLANGSTLFALLSSDAIDEAALRAAFDELTAKLQAQPKTLSQRLADAGFKRRPSNRSLPSDE